MLHVLTTKSVGCGRCRLLVLLSGCVSGKPCLLAKFESQDDPFKGGLLLVLSQRRLRSKKKGFPCFVKPNPVGFPGPLIPRFCRKPELERNKKKTRYSSDFQ